MHLVIGATITYKRRIGRRKNTNYYLNIFLSPPEGYTGSTEDWLGQLVFRQMVTLIATNSIQLPPLNWQQEISQKMDCRNNSSILSPQLGHVELSQWKAPWQCWHSSFGKARRTRCKYNSITSIGTYRNDTSNSSFPVCSSYHSNRILHCPQRAVALFYPNWEENLHHWSSTSRTLFSGSSMHEELAGISSTDSLRRISFTFPFYSRFQYPTLNSRSTTSGCDLLIEATL